MSAKYGYIGNSPDNTPVRIARRTYNLTGVQTTFTFEAGYEIGYVDVYLNGVRQVENDDFIATDGSTVGFSSAPIAGDIVEIVAYKAYDVVQDRNNVAGDFRVYGNANISGIVTASGFVGNVTGTASTATAAATAFSLSGTPNINVGVVTATSFRGDGSLLSGMSGSASVTVVTSNISLTKNISYMISTDRSVLTLPASPSTGDAVDIYNNVAGIHTLARNGSTIMGIAEDVEFGEQGLRFKVWYNGSTWSLF